MDYVIKVRELLLGPKPLSNEDAVEIINTWRKKPESYKSFLDTEKASVFLRAYCFYSNEDQEHIFEQTDLKILAPKPAQKFFALGSESLNNALMQTLNALTFSDDDDTIYAWPYFNLETAKSMDAISIRNVLTDFHYVFDCNTDKFGLTYNTFYNKLLEAEECVDCLAVNSFNLDEWANIDLNDLGTRARHLLFSNYSVSDGGCEDASFRKLLVHYLYGMWDNCGDIAYYIQQEQMKRNN